MPISTLAASSQANVVATEKARQPKTASVKKYRITRLGPWRSNKLPSGNCMAAKPKK